jgi:effector-binding domain-containing protein
MIGQPKVENRKEQHYVGIRTQVPVTELSKAIPQHLGEVFAWLNKEGIAPAGAPFIRYYVINMESKLDVEMGVPVAKAVPGNDHVRAGVLPAGRYAALVYTDIKNGINGNAALLDWGAAEGFVWDKWDDANGDGFGARYESFLTDPAKEPDQAKWETEVAIRLADKQPRK